MTLDLGRIFLFGLQHPSFKRLDKAVNNRVHFVDACCDDERSPEFFQEVMFGAVSRLFVSNLCLLLRPPKIVGTPSLARNWVSSLVSLPPVNSFFLFFLFLTD